MGVIFNASFFGIELPAINKKEEEGVFSDETKKAEHTTLTEAQKSATIKVANSNNNNTSAPRESEQKDSKMLPSATQRSSFSSSKPADWIDPVEWSHLASQILRAGGRSAVLLR